MKGLPDDMGSYGWFVYGRIKNVLSFSNPASSTQAVETTGKIVELFKKNYSIGTYYPDMLTWLYPASQVTNYAQYAQQGYSPNPNPTNAPSSGYHSGFAGVFFTDNEPDVYTITLPTGKMQFVFDGLGNPVPLQAQSIKIEALNLGTREPATNGLLHEFIVTTSDGVKYYFGSPNGDTSYTESISLSTRILEITTQASKDDVSYIYKWNLKKIVYPTSEIITYTYSGNRDYNFSTNTYLQQDWLYTTDGAGNTIPNRPYEFDPKFYNYNNKTLVYSSTSPNPFYTWTRRYTVQTTYSSTDAKQLATISSALGSLQFTYQAAARQDVGGTTGALAAIRLVDTHGVDVKKLELVQHYADYGQLTPNALGYDRYHLLLDKVLDKGKGCDYIEALSFGYNTQAFCRNTALKDAWGYLNGISYPSNNVVVEGAANPGGIHPFNSDGRVRNPNVDYTQALILKSISAATGGVQTFTYELHDYSSFQPNTSTANYTAGGLRIKQIAKFDGLDHANDIVDNFIYRKVDDATVSSGCFGDPGLYAKIQLIHGYGYSGTLAQLPPNVTPLTEAQIRGSIPHCISTSDNNANKLDFYYLLRSTESMYQYAADYLDYSCVTVVHGQKGKTRYEFTNWSDVSHQDYIDSDTKQCGNDLNVCANDPFKSSTGTTFLPLPTTNFNQLDGVAMGYADGVTANYPNRSSRAAERGLPITVTQLDNNGSPVAMTINQYDFAHASVTLPTVSAVVIKPDMEVFGFSQYSRYFQLYYYNVSSQWCPLTQSTAIVYDQQGGGAIAKSMATTTLMEYSNFFPSKTTTYTASCSSPTTCTQPSAATRYVTEYRRTQDFANNADQTTTIGLLRTAGMFAPVIEQVQYSLSPSGTKSYQGATLVEYQAANGYVLPYRTYGLPYSVTSFTPATTANGGSGWTLNKDSNYQLNSTVTGYTADARPVNTLDRTGVPSTTIWGYNHTLPIATVSNGIATVGSSGTGLLATAAHTSFEEDGLNGVDGDGWSIPASFSTEAKTGARSGRILCSQSPYGSGKTLIIPAGPNRHGKMVFSCWVKVPAGTTSNAGFCVVVVGQGANSAYQQAGTDITAGQDWQYIQNVVDLDAYAWNVGLVATDNLQIQMYPWCPYGTDLLYDEVRIHRADALMQTMTYAPLVGKTSTTDPSGVTTYYTYDSNNVARLVLNQNHDIVQRSQQHLVGQTARPSADFSLPTINIPECAVAVTAAYTACATGTTYTWDFGDGTPRVTSSSATNSHSYSNPGTYTVALLVIDANKSANRSTKSVLITDSFHTDITSDGPTEADFCTNANPDPVTLTASVPGGCQNALYFMWQQKTNSGTWNTVGYQAAFTQSFSNASVVLRCVVGMTGGGNNANSGSVEEITIRGYYGSSSCSQTVSKTISK